MEFISFTRFFMAVSLILIYVIQKLVGLAHQASTNLKPAKHHDEMFAHVGNMDVRHLAFEDQLQFVDASYYNSQHPHQHHSRDNANSENSNTIGSYSRTEAAFQPDQLNSNIDSKNHHLNLDSNLNKNINYLDSPSLDSKSAATRARIARAKLDNALGSKLSINAIKDDDDQNYHNHYKKMQNRNQFTEFDSGDHLDSNEYLGNKIHDQPENSDPDDEAPFSVSYLSVSVLLFELNERQGCLGNTGNYTVMRTFSAINVGQYVMKVRGFRIGSPLSLDSSGSSSSSSRSSNKDHSDLDLDNSESYSSLKPQRRPEITVAIDDNGLDDGNFAQYDQKTTEKMTEQFDSSTCHGYGFTIYDCQPFDLEPNHEHKIRIAFTPDFTLTKTIVTLTILTNVSDELRFALVATIPRNLLISCNKSLPRPDWETTMHHLLAVGMIIIITCSIFIAYLEAKLYLTNQDRAVSSKRRGGAMNNAGPGSAPSSISTNMQQPSTPSPAPSEVATSSSSSTTSSGREIDKNCSTPGTSSSVSANRQRTGKCARRRRSRTAAAVVSSGIADNRASGQIGHIATTVVAQTVGVRSSERRSRNQRPARSYNSVSSTPDRRSTTIPVDKRDNDDSTSILSSQPVAAKNRQHQNFSESIVANSTVKSNAGKANKRNNKRSSTELHRGSSSSPSTVGASPLPIVNADLENFSPNPPDNKNLVLQGQSAFDSLKFSVKMDNQVNDSVLSINQGQADKNRSHQRDLNQLEQKGQMFTKSRVNSLPSDTSTEKCSSSSIPAVSDAVKSSSSQQKHATTTGTVASTKFNISNNKSTSNRNTSPLSPFSVSRDVDHGHRSSVDTSDFSALISPTKPTQRSNTMIGTSTTLTTSRSGANLGSQLNHTKLQQPQQKLPPQSKNTSSNIVTNESTKVVKIDKRPIASVAPVEILSKFCVDARDSSLTPPLSALNQNCNSWLSSGVKNVQTLAMTRVRSQAMPILGRSSGSNASRLSSLDCDGLVDVASECGAKSNTSDVAGTGKYWSEGNDLVRIYGTEIYGAGANAAVACSPVQSTTILDTELDHLRATSSPWNTNLETFSTVGPNTAPTSLGNGTSDASALTNRLKLQNRANLNITNSPQMIHHQPSNDVIENVASLLINENNRNAALQAPGGGNMNGNLSHHNTINCNNRNENNVASLLMMNGNGLMNNGNSNTAASANCTTMGTSPSPAHNSNGTVDLFNLFNPDYGPNWIGWVSRQRS